MARCTSGISIARLCIALLTSARSVPAMDVPGSPVEAGRRADEVALPLKRGTALRLGVLQLLDAGMTPYNTREIVPGWSSYSDRCDEVPPPCCGGEHTISKPYSP